METPLALRVPKAAAKKLSDAGFQTVGQLLNYAPMRYYHWGRLTDISSLVVGEHATILAKIKSSNIVSNQSGRGVRLIVTVTDGKDSLTCTFFAKNPYMLSHHRKTLKPGATALVSGKVSEYRGQIQMVQPEFEEIDEDSEQYAQRIAGRPIPIYRSISGLPSWKIGALIQSVLEATRPARSKDGSVLPKAVQDRHALCDHWTALEQLHAPVEDADWRRARRTLAWEEALILQTALLQRRLPAPGQPGVVAPALTVPELADQLELGLPFELTSGQKAAWGDIRADLEQSEPMQRLLQGDVGSGKTVVALLAMLQAAGSGKQSALLAPTEVLARQHWGSLTALLEKAGISVSVHLLTSKRAAAEKQQVLMSLASGEPAIVVGTHALLQEGVQIPQLGLVVVDEQHRFGVAQREQLRSDRDSVPHLLVMTATPIPRTIAMTVFGDLDTTVIPELPAGRQPIQTFLVDERNTAWMERVWERAREEVDGGGRVYVVCPRIDGDGAGEPDLFSGDSTDDQTGKRALPAAEEVAAYLAQLQQFKGIPIGLAHGRRTPEENARAFSDFQSGAAPVLVATTVIEVGVDVPEATMMVVLDGTRFGLSQLHQLRGRVGRSDRNSVAMITHAGDIAPTSMERLQAIASTTDGFELAEIDLRLRKEGNVLGKAQSGHTSDLRFLSVRRDGPTIFAARAVAQQILESDPTLADHSELRARVSARSGEELIWMERS